MDLNFPQEEMFCFTPMANEMLRIIESDMTPEERAKAWDELEKNYPLPKRADNAEEPAPLANP